ncbi:hypothetical protein ACFL0Q_03985 [Thermodesulfobacteriota bacterium]
MLKDAFAAGKPILGICLGAQIIVHHSEENDTRCLGLLEGEVKRFPSPLASPGEDRLKIPHMGWNGLRVLRPHPVLEGTVLLRAQLLPLARRLRVRPCNDSLRNRVPVRHRPCKPRRHTIPPGEERPSRIAHSEKFRLLEPAPCSVRESYPVSM